MGKQTGPQLQTACDLTKYLQHIKKMWLTKRHPGIDASTSTYMHFLTVLKQYLASTGWAPKGYVRETMTATQPMTEIHVHIRCSRSCAVWSISHSTYLQKPLYNTVIALVPKPLHSLNPDVLQEAAVGIGDFPAPYSLILAGY
jgi:hypothetical protein